jgi:hypothetical protein
LKKCNLYIYGTIKKWRNNLTKTVQDVGQPEVRGKIAALLKSAHENEIKAVEIMSKSI